MERMPSQFDLRDVRFDVYRSGDQCVVRVTHLPTALSARAEGTSEYRCRTEASAALSLLLTGER